MQQSITYSLTFLIPMIRIGTPLYQPPSSIYRLDNIQRRIAIVIRQIDVSSFRYEVFEQFEVVIRS
jgi:hypothetical protein